MYLRDIAYVTASRVVTSDEIARSSGLDLDFINDKIGVKKRFFLDENESQVTLAVRACRKLLESVSDLNLKEVQLLIVVTQNSEYQLPQSSSIVQTELSLPVNTACFDISLGCSGYVYALSIAKSIMLCENMQNAILVTCDPYSRIIGPGDKDTVALFSDAASATWLSAEKGAIIGKADFGTDGSKAHALYAHSINHVDQGCLTNNIANTSNEQHHRLKMNGRAIFNFMMGRIPGSIERCFQKNMVSAGQIDFFVFHQASAFLLKQLALKMKLDQEKVVNKIEMIGNTVSSSIPISLKLLMSEKDLTHKKLIISGFGVGLSWATNVLSFQEENYG